jgi:tRNA wybutosine-synthesizing protein 3
MILFDTSKERTIKKMNEDDRSNKGSVDKPIRKLVALINKTKNFYTTSSCSGRVIVIKIPASGRKIDAEFIYRTHDLADGNKLNTVINELLNYTSGDSIWFRQEPAILHVSARTIDDASKLLRLVRPIGFKRSGIFEAEKRVILELVSTERIDAILARDGKILVNPDYINILVEEANKRLEQTWVKTKKFEEIIKQEF